MQVLIPSNAWLIVGVTLMLFVPELAKRNVIENFAARKATHLLCGLMFMLVQYDWVTSIYMMMVALSFMALVLFKPPPFAQHGDFGILSYGITVIVFVLMQWPPYFLATLFVADPTAAIVGRSFRPEKTGKTWIGSSTFFCTSLLLTNTFESDFWKAFLIATISTAAERLPGDNAALGIIGGMHAYYSSHV